MKRSLETFLTMLVCGFFLGAIPVHADVIYEPSLLDLMYGNDGILLLVGLAVVAIVFVTVSLLIYLKRKKKKSQVEERFI